MTEQQPLVSIVIACYNHAQFVQESIQSVIDQDYENIELIIIDDGSNDNSVEVIQEMIPACEERFVRFEFRHRPNKGLCATLNEALEWCKGEYFSALASDDIALPHKTSFLISKLKTETVDAAFGLLHEFSDTEKFIKESKGVIYHNFEDLILQKNIPAAPTAMIRMEVLKKIGGYQESLAIEDWYMWLALTNKGDKLITYPEVLTLYRRHESNMSKNLKKMHSGRMEILDYFKDASIYSAAVKNEYILEARRSAYSDTKRTFVFLNKAGWLNKTSLLILFKSLTPKIFINMKRKLLGQKDL